MTTTNQPDITAALMDAGVDANAIFLLPDGIVRVNRSDGGRIYIGEDEDERDAWWHWTVYDSDDTPERTDGSDDLTELAREVARLVDA